MGLMRARERYLGVSPVGLIQGGFRLVAQERGLNPRLNSILLFFDSYLSTTILILILSVQSSKVNPPAAFHPRLA